MYCMTITDTNKRNTSFVAPDGSNLNEIRDLTHRMTDLVLQLRSEAGARSFNRAPNENIANTALNSFPVDDEELFQQFGSLLDGAINTESPNFLGHMGAFPTAMSAIGDFAASSLNNNMIGLELSPAFSILEEELSKQLALFFGLPESSGGSIATGGSLSNLHALAVARNTILGDSKECGLHGINAPCILASEAAHASIEKNAMLLGLGTDGLIKVSTTDNSQMDVDDLQNQINTAIAAGKTPFCVVATAGTTVTGNIDPLPEIGAIAWKNGLWFHVDAAWGGGLQFSKKYKHRLSGIEQADSITFCPQKLLLVALSSSLVMFRDWQQMQSNFRINFTYLQESESFTDRSEIGVQGSRPAEILKLWLSLKHVGLNAYGKMIESWIELADRVNQLVSELDYMESVGLPESAIICFRFCPPEISANEYDKLNERMHKLIHDEAGVYLSKVRYKSQLWLRAVFQNPFTDSSVIDGLFDYIVESKSKQRLE